MSQRPRISPSDAEKQVAEAQGLFDAEFKACKAEEITTLLERLKAQLDRDQAWLRHFDFKLGPILAADGVLIGLLAKLLADNHANLYACAPRSAAIMTGGILGTLALLSISVVYGILAISPRLSWRELVLWKYTPEALVHDTSPATQLFFDHLASYANFDLLTKDIITTHTQPARYAAQLLQQVHANATVAHDKAKQVRWSIKFLFLGILLAGVSAAGTLILWSQQW